MMDAFNDSLNRVLRYNADYTHADFHNKIMENRAETTPALVYADWLEENGKPAHAEVIRKHVGVYNNGVDAGSYWTSDQPVQAHASREPYSYVRLAMRSPSGKGMLNWIAHLAHGGEGAIQKKALMDRLVAEGADPSGDYTPDEEHTDARL